MRFHARLSTERKAAPERVESGFKRAAATFREFSVVFWLAVTLLEHGEWLVEQGRGDEARPLIDEAREIFERLRARPCLERLEKLAPAETVVRR